MFKELILNKFKAEVVVIGTVDLAGAGSNQTGSNFNALKKSLANLDQTRRR